jgi:membrane protease YdiL (CAAX protease family)
VNRAIVISGVTFGIGHIVNLARGYTGEQQLLQIVVAVAIGLVLALLVAVTGSIMPGVVFHILINISGDLTTMDLQQELYVSVGVLVICLAYGTYLVRRLRRQGPAGAFVGASDRSNRHSAVSGNDPKN